MAGCLLGFFPTGREGFGVRADLPRDAGRAVECERAAFGLVRAGLRADVLGVDTRRVFAI